MLALADVDSGHYAAVAMLDALAVPCNGNLSHGVHTGIQGHESSPSEEEDEEKPRDDHAEADLAFGIAGTGLRADRKD